MQNEETPGPYCTGRVEEVESVERVDRTTAKLAHECTAYGFAVLVRSIEDLVELEKSQRPQCTLANALT
jgi:hypothetical protein